MSAGRSTKSVGYIKKHPTLLAFVVLAVNWVFAVTIILLGHLVPGWHDVPPLDVLLSDTGTTIGVVIMATGAALVAGFLFLFDVRNSRREAEINDASRRVADQLQMYADNMSGVILYVCRNGLLEWGSKRLKEQFGVTPDEAHGQHIEMFAHPDDQAAVRNAFSTAATKSEEVKLTVRYQPEPGDDASMRWFEWEITVPEPDSDNEDAATSGFVVVISDVTARVLAQEAATEALAFMQHRSTHDDLTDLPNRYEAIRLADAAARKASRTSPSSIIYCDVDGFKAINEAFSQDTGDDVLRNVAKRLAGVVVGRGQVTRMGGDEFVVLLPNVDEETADELALLMIKAIASTPFDTNYRPVNVGLSVGVVTISTPTSGEDFISMGDSALRHAKESSRGSSVRFSPEMRANSLEDIDLASRIKDALGTRSFRAWGQPIVDISSRQLVEYEMLARWVEQDGTILPAAQWVDVAEKFGLMNDIGMIVVEDAVRGAALLPESVRFAVNASGAQLLSRKFLERLMKLLEFNDVDPSRMIIEVTESVLIDPGTSATVVAALKAARAEGMGVHLDDFGTGYSSVKHMSDFPITGVKLDKSFTQMLTGEEDDRFALVKGVADLAIALGVSRIAEGVETDQQAEMLARAGWTYGQGWLFGKPAAIYVEAGHRIQ